MEQTLFALLGGLCGAVYVGSVDPESSEMRKLARDFSARLKLHEAAVDAALRECTTYHA